MTDLLTNAAVRHMVVVTDRLRGELAAVLQPLSQQGQCSYHNVLMAFKKCRCIFRSEIELADLRGYFRSNSNRVAVDRVLGMVQAVREEAEGKSAKKVQPAIQIKMQLPTSFMVNRSIPEYTCEDEESMLDAKPTSTPREKVRKTTGGSLSKHLNAQLSEIGGCTSRSKLLSCIETGLVVGQILHLRKEMGSVRKMFGAYRKQKLNAAEFQLLVQTILGKDNDSKMLFDMLANDDGLTFNDVLSIERSTERLCKLVEQKIEVNQLKHPFSISIRHNSLGNGDIVLLRAKQPSTLTIGGEQDNRGDTPRAVTPSLKLKSRLSTLKWHRQRELQHTLSSTLRPDSNQHSDLLKILSKKCAPAGSRPHQTKEWPRLTTSYRLRTLFSNKLIQALQLSPPRTASLTPLTVNSSRLNQRKSRLEDSKHL